MEIAELFNKLESNQLQTVEEIKKTFHENFNSTKESWLVNGLFDYYVSTSSMRSVEILVGVREPHDKHLFDKITDALKSPLKLHALTLLGHIIRRRPTWVYKITQHQIMKELLKVLKAETDIVCLMSAVLIIIVLLPMIPALIGPFLQDVFEGFSRVAAWNTMNQTKLPEEHLLHLQVSLYALFHRLYGMYPCNFISFLRHEYGQRENLGIFSHTIKPMLETVKMHPLLVTASKDAETATTRWKKMEDHDVIVECAKYAVDTSEKSREEGNFQSINTSLRSRGSMEQSIGLDLSYMQQLKSSFHPPSSFANSQLPAEQEFWSPSIFSGFVTPPVEESAPTSIPQTPNSQSYIVSASLPHQEGTSPPEAAIEATPETTPVKDMRHLTSRHPPVSSSAVRALNSFSSTKWQGLTSGSSTPQSQPSSPMKKELSPFRFTETSAFEQPRRDSVTTIASQKLTSVLLERQVLTETHTGDKPILNLRPKTPGQPTSPLRVTSQHDINVPNSPIPMETTAPLIGGVVTKPLPEKNGFRLESSEPVPVPLPSHLHSDTSSTQEDQEVLEIVRQGEQLRIDTQPKHVGVSSDTQRQCDSVLQEVHPPHVGEYEECQQEAGSPCMSGGLHMPNSRSMLDFARRVHHRQRFYSQCVPDTSNEGMAGLSTGSSPGQGSTFPQQDRVRRANSCPEMKKGPSLPTCEVNISRPLDETEEFEEAEGTTLEAREGLSRIVNGKTTEPNIETEGKRRRLLSASTQTVDWVPLPYEHLFLSVFPFQSCDMKSSSTPSPAPTYHQGEPLTRLSPCAMVDKYIETVIQGQEAKKPKQTGTETEIKILKEQLVLLNIQLHYERQRREVHAERNRRLLGKSRSNRALDEHNTALREQLSLLQRDIEQLHSELEKCKKEARGKEQQIHETTSYWQNQCALKQKENSELKTQQKLLEQETKKESERNALLRKEMQEAESKLFDIGNEMREAMAQAVAGEQLRETMEQLQKKVLLMGELQQRYRDRFSQLQRLRCPEEEATVLQESYINEVQGLQDMLEFRNTTLEAAKARVIELENSLCRKDQVIAEQKRTLRSVEEEFGGRLEAVESKYKSQRAINKKLEENMLELYHRLDLAEEHKRKATRSPDVSGAHEVTVSSVDSSDRQTGPTSFSPHNSPLSQSLGSPGGLSVSGILGRECVEMKNLQSIVDQPERVSRMGVTPSAGSPSIEQPVSQPLGMEPNASTSNLGGEEG